MSFFVCALCLLLSLAPLLGANKSPIDNSVCKELIHGVPSARQLQLRSILPDKTFWKFVSDHSKPHDDIMFVDVDMNTWSLLVNQVVALKMTGSKLVVFAIAYDDNICKELWSKNVPCYYEKKWIKGLYTAYKKWTGSTLPPGQNLVNVQMGRMITTLVTICEGHNVFLSDGDVVFFRDPMDYVYDNVNIMITATAIGPNPDWGIPYMADNSSTYYALNNGVVFYRNNPVTRSFLMQLTVNCIEFLNRGPDSMWGFLQTRFHVYMRDHHLLFYPSSAVSDPSSFKLVSNYTNKAGECYDCYYGEISIPVNSKKKKPKMEVLRLGAFPMKRYTSLCGEVDREEYNRIIPIAARALKRNDTMHWGWGQLKHGASRVLAIHANCILVLGEDYTLARFEKKVKWFRSVESWFVD